MEQEAAASLIRKLVHDSLQSDGLQAKLTDDCPLIGSESALDSMKLVELCLALEDVASDHGFEFDWTSDSAMSRSRSMFRSTKSLAEEFARQSESAR